MRTETQTKTTTKKKTAKTEKPPREKKVQDFVSRLPVKLTEKELLERGQRLAKCQADLAEHNARADEIKKELRSAEAKIEAERAYLSGVIRERAEFRDVACERWVDYVGGEIREVRCDSGEVINSRPLQPHERQVSLPLKDALEAANADAGSPFSPADLQEIASAAAPGRGLKSVGTVEVDERDHNPDEPDDA